MGPEHTMRKVLRGYARDKTGNLVLIGTIPVPHSKDKPSPRERQEKVHLVRQGATIFKKRRFVSTLSVLRLEEDAAAMRGVYFFRVSNDPQAIAAKMNPAALSASVRTLSRGVPNSSYATLPVNIAGHRRTRQSYDDKSRPAHVDR
jgi:hypothetical protein